MPDNDTIKDMLRKRIAELTDELTRCKNALKQLEGGGRGVTDLGETTILESSPSLPTVSKLMRAIVKVLIKHKNQGIRDVSVEELYQDLKKYGYNFAGKDEAADIRNVSMAIYRNGGRDVVRDDEKRIRLSEKWAPIINK